jgi:type III restriction enzyme
MATGVGKTKVMGLTLAWSYFHKLYEVDCRLLKDFLVIAPNIIVLNRLLKDFDCRVVDIMGIDKGKIAEVEVK